MNRNVSFRARTAAGAQHVTEHVLLKKEYFCIQMSPGRVGMAEQPYLVQVPAALCPGMGLLSSSSSRGECLWTEAAESRVKKCPRTLHLGSQGHPLLCPPHCSCIRFWGTSVAGSGAALLVNSPWSCDIQSPVNVAGFEHMYWIHKG